jgi:hypothetical protein
MNRIMVRFFALLLVCIVAGRFPVAAGGLRTVGLVVALSWSSTPLWIGVEASTDLSWSVLSGALFLTPDGKTLFTGHLDVPVQQGAAAFLRATAGFYYFSSSQPFPYLLAGAGISVLPLASSPLFVAFSGEFIYPLAFPLPMFSISGGWLP